MTDSGKGDDAHMSAFGALLYLFRLSVSAALLYLIVFPTTRVKHRLARHLPTQAQATELNLFLMAEHPS